MCHGSLSSWGYCVLFLCLFVSYRLFPATIKPTDGWNLNTQSLVTNLDVLVIAGMMPLGGCVVVMKHASEGGNALYCIALHTHSQTLV